MDKEELIIILQCCLFSFEGGSEQEIINYNTYPPELVRIGVKLSEYLRSIKLGDKKCNAATAEN